MNLRSLDFPVEMATATRDIIRQFYVPALAAAVTYDRGVGFFSSRWMELAAQGLAGLAENGGNARLVASPILDAQDWEALKRGTEAQTDTALYEALRPAVEGLEGELQSDTLSAISWMIADGLLEIRVAVPDGDLDGDFHDKFGYFRDESGDQVAFHGSPNDSRQAFHNYESISIFCSWMDRREAERVEALKDRFARIWNNTEPNLRTYRMPEAIRENIAKLRHKSTRPYSRRAAATVANEWKWRHQADAEREFISRRHGVLEMATGTGKTRTAIRILQTLYKSQAIDTAIVTAYGTDLLDQWYQELNQLSGHTIYRHYERNKEINGYLLNPDHSILLASREMFADLVAHIPQALHHRALLVFDEVHGVGAAGLVAKLSGRLRHFGYRIGLSATPEREYDQEGNAFIAEQIGPVVFRFGLEEAIRRGILCEFDYVPIEYEFSETDKLAIRSAFARHSAKLAAGERSGSEELYQDLAKVRKLSRQKLAPFRAHLASHPGLLHRSIVFVEEAEYGMFVQNIILEHSGSYHTYYAEDDRHNLVRFAAGELDSLITCRRIAEGIDVRSINHIVLFSASRARLETIQRIGRCLRIDPTQPEKRAVVVDFIRTDQTEEEGSMPSADASRREWLTSLSHVTRQEIIA